MRRGCLARWVFPLACLLGLAFPAMAAVPQAFLIQNSGWMEPFYADPESPLKPLAAAIVEAVAEPGGEVYVAAFSQATADNPSPLLVYPNPRNTTPRQAIEGIALARKNRAGTLADTDFQEAVGQTILRQFQGRAGIVWIFTNNRNSPGNDQDTARRNQEFYDLLHKEPSIARTLVYPLSMPVRGGRYGQAQGLMVYALAYGKAAEAGLLALVESPRLKAVLTALPARLKPLDRESVRLTPRRILDAPGVGIRLGGDGKTTVVEVGVSERRPGVSIQADLENLFYPYRIDAARVSARFVSGGRQYPLSVAPEAIASLRPGERREVTVGFPIPHAQIPSLWSWAHIRRFGTQVILPGSIHIVLADQHLALDPGFVGQLRSNFPNDPISRVFTPPGEAQTSSVAIPLSVRINYPVYPLALLAGLGALLLAALLWALHELGRPRLVVAVVDGAPQRLVLKLLQTLPVKAAHGEIVGEIRRGLLGPKIVRVAEGHRVQLPPPT